MRLTFPDGSSVEAEPGALIALAEGRMREMAKRASALQSAIDEQVLHELCGWRFMGATVQSFDRHQETMHALVSNAAKARIQQREQEIREGKP